MNKALKIGVDLGGTNMRVGLLGSEGLLDKKVIPTPSKASKEEVLVQLQLLIDQLITPEVAGIGLGVPSVVDAQEGIVYNVANIPSWDEVPLKQILQTRYGVPVFVNNDSNCFTWGVKCFGEGKPYRNIIGLTIGTGIGAGVVINNRLYEGLNTGAGEVGSLPYLNHDFEHYCSSGFFVRYHNTTGAQVAQKAAEGDKAALHIWNEFGGHIGALIKALLFTYDPQAIILGGGIASAFPLYETAMRKALESFPYKSVADRLQIIVSQTEDAALLGASALVDIHLK